MHSRYSINTCWMNEYTCRNWVVHREKCTLPLAFLLLKKTVTVATKTNTQKGAVLALSMPSHVQPVSKSEFHFQSLSWTCPFPSPLLWAKSKPRSSPSMDSKSKSLMSLCSSISIHSSAQQQKGSSYIWIAQYPSSVQNPLNPELLADNPNWHQGLWGPVWRALS